MKDAVSAKKQAAIERLHNGDLHGARSLLTECVRRAPRDAEVLYLIGTIDLREDRPGEAVAQFRQAVHLMPGYRQAVQALADALAQAGQFEEATRHYRSLLAAAPSAFAHFSLANVLVRQHRFDEAVSHYDRALTLEPKRPEIYNNLGNAYYLQGKYPLAETAYQEALRLQPDHPAAYEGYTNLATTQLLMEHVEDAQANYARALELKPGFKRALAGKAAVLERCGDAEGAYELLRPLLESADVDANTAWVFSNLCRALDRCDEAAALMERLLDDRGAPLDNYDGVLLHFALGRLHDAAADYPRAFEHYRQGNALAGRSFNARAHKRFIDELMACYSRDFMARAPRAANHAQPVFIIGMPRSGTTLVEQILAGHHAVFGAGEREEVAEIAATVPSTVGSGERYPHSVAALTQAHCDLLAQRYLDALAKLAPPDALRVTDKMPANFLHLGLINLLFPEAYIIHCVRDPLDTCLSCYFQQFGAQDFSFDLAHVGAYYRQYQRLMGHWRETLDLRMMDLHYEDLVQEPERISRELVAFCGLVWDENCMRFHELRRPIHTASYDQVRQPIYSRSVGRWRYYADYLGPLQEALGED